jgi:hypothetical protein
LWLASSSDHLHRAEVIQRRDGVRLRVDGRPGAAYSAIGERLAFSVDGQVAYPVLSGGHWRVVLGAEQLPGAWEGIGELVFSPAGGELAFAAQFDGDWQVVRGDHPRPQFSSLAAGSLEFSPDGGRFAYVGEREGRAIAVVDDRESAPLDGVRKLAFSGGQSQVGYIGRTRTGTVELETLVIDGAPRLRGDAIADFGWSPGGDRLAALVERSGAWFAWIDGDWSGPFDRISSVRFSPDGAHVAFVAARGAADRVYLDGAPGPEAEEVPGSSLAFAPDGRLAYRERVGKQWRVVFGGQADPLHTEVDDPRLAGGTVGYLARSKSRSFLVLNGRSGKGFDRARDLVLSPDGERFAFLAQDGARTEVVSDAGERALGLVIDGTLAFGQSSAGRIQWGCVVGNDFHREIEIVLEGGERRRVGFDELLDAVARSALEPKGAGMLRRWVSGELSR